jgi:hypothetical protein
MSLSLKREGGQGSLLMAHGDFRRPSALNLLRHATVDAPRMGWRDTSSTLPPARWSPDCSRMRWTLDVVIQIPRAVAKDMGPSRRWKAERARHQHRLDGARPTMTNDGLAAGNK